MATAADLKLRFPEFASVPDDRVEYWLTDAALTVDASWGADQDRALMMLAAHNLAMNPAPGGASIPTGVTSFKSGAFSVSFTDAAASQSAAGGYQATRYGQDFLKLLRIVKGGPMLVSAEPIVPGTLAC